LVVRGVKVGKRKDNKEDLNTHKQLDRLEKENKELKQANNRLRRKLKELERYEGFFKDNASDSSSGHQESKKKVSKCPECYKGNLLEVSIAGRLFHRCHVCGYRTKAKKCQKKKKKVMSR